MRYLILIMILIMSSPVYAGYVDIDNSNFDYPDLDDGAAIVGFSDSDWLYTGVAGIRDTYDDTFTDYGNSSNDVAWFNVGSAYQVTNIEIKKNDVFTLNYDVGHQTEATCANCTFFDHTVRFKAGGVTLHEVMFSDGEWGVWKSKEIIYEADSDYTYIEIEFVSHGKRLHIDNVVLAVDRDITVDYMNKVLSIFVAIAFVFAFGGGVLAGRA